MARMAGDTLLTALERYSASPSRGPDGAREGFLVDGELISLNEVKRGYQMGDHIIDAGPGNLFWASNVQSTQTMSPKPLEHGLGILMQHGPSQLSQEELNQIARTREQELTRIVESARSKIGDLGLVDGLSPDPRDYMMPDGVMRSGLLPMGMTIDAAIRKGLWT